MKMKKTEHNNKNLENNGKNTNLHAERRKVQHPYYFNNTFIALIILNSSFKEMCYNKNLKGYPIITRALDLAVNQ